MISPKAVVAQVSQVAGADHPDYLERVYAGVLGKLIGVYLGRPVENWSFERIRDEIGLIEYYIHDQRDRLLIVTDDDISGTFTFLRAMADYGNEVTAAQIGQTWLNYLIEETTILWWGGLGNSTEHTAYLRLKNGIQAPESGSAELNTKIVAEQIGAQIFIEGWGLICPGDPASAVEFARKAASVSHDGEAIYGALVVAALVAEAFVSSDIDILLDKALTFIPADSMIATVIGDLRKWQKEGLDWKEARQRLEKEYGYHRFPGNCPIIPNHGLIILGLLWGEGDFDLSMSIVNTCGWDTDCNSGNLGTILGVRNGLAGLEGKDWRGPVADRLYLPSADGGRSISDAAHESLVVANLGRKLAGLEPMSPKKGAKFHFSLPGSVQGWQGECSHRDGALRITGPATTPTFIPPEIKDLKTGYVLVANPTLYPGHTVRLSLSGQGSGRLIASHYGPHEESIQIDGPAFSLTSSPTELTWLIPETGGQPIHEIGLEIEGTADLDWMDWKGVPGTSYPPAGGGMWARAWAKSLDRFQFERDKYEFLTHNVGVGMLTQGSREWQNYRVETRLTPKMATSAGLAVRVQGLRRYYAFVFGNAGEVRLDKCLDGRSTLARTSFPWEAFRDYLVEIEVSGNEIRAWIDGKLQLSAIDGDRPLLEGAFGFMVEAGCMGAGTPRIMPI